MFESDDYDQVLSQLDLTELCHHNQNIRPFKEETSQSYSKRIIDIKGLETIDHLQHKLPENNGYVTKTITAISEIFQVDNQVSPKHSKRKLIDSHFDNKRKRKFPGPAGLLNGSLNECKENDMCQIELLSQDVDYSQGHAFKGIFESPLWFQLLRDTKGLNKVDTIKNIKQQALKGNLRRRKAETITAYVESVDRSAIDPLIILRDATENIKCTLHRDAWVAFSPYIVAECCALVLHSPTVLTTGSAFKKHYLNITLNNIHALYSTAVRKEEGEIFPAGFNKIYEEDYTIIKSEQENTGNKDSTDLLDDSILLDGLDGAFSDDIF